VAGAARATRSPTCAAEVNRGFERYSCFTPMNRHFQR
jgi:hypothetical protein